MGMHSGAFVGRVFALSVGVLALAGLGFAVSDSAQAQPGGCVARSSVGNDEAGDNVFTAAFAALFAADSTTGVFAFAAGM